jgi:hypothetical protein
MRRLMPTAKTTVLPANDSPTNQKGLALCEAIRRQPPISVILKSFAIAGLASLGWAQDAAGRVTSDVSNL